jgi:hypothetical protein
MGGNAARGKTGTRSNDWRVGIATALTLLAALLGAAALAVPAGARVGAVPTGRAFARHLAGLDPGGAVGGNTTVGSSRGEFLIGVPNRVNFMMALGSGATIVGGGRPDQLGALGRNATIDGGGGNDLIHGGPGHDVIDGGAGNDLIIDTMGSATIYTGAGRDEVDVAGHAGGADQVICAARSVDRIFVNRGDHLSASCHGSRVVFHRPPSTPAGSPPAAAANGCTDNPAVNCSYLASSGLLPGSLWSHQKVKAQQCPASHPYLQYLDTVPFGSNFPFGVEIKNLGNVGFFAPRIVRDDDYVLGAQEGSVTNWTFSEQHWEMWLNCTSDKANGWKH